MGERALVFARDYFAKRGYRVWSSGSGRREDSYILLSYPRLRHKGYEACVCMMERFDPESVLQLTQAAEDAKKTLPGNLGGGDPDLFVFKEDGMHQFFVEAKHKDKVSKKQKECFRLIEKHLGCEVVIAQITEMKGPRRNP